MFAGFKKKNKTKRKNKKFLKSFYKESCRIGHARCDRERGMQLPSASVWRGLVANCDGAWLTYVHVYTSLNKCPAEEAAA